MNWLLDVNVNRKLIPVLMGFGIKAESSIIRGWRLLSNGDLIEMAVTSGFGIMLTNDVRILKSAGKSLSKYPQFALVLLCLPQVPSKTYLDLFEKAWSNAPILPIAGKAISWPKG